MRSFWRTTEAQRVRLCITAALVMPGLLLTQAPPAAAIDLAGIYQQAEENDPTYRAVWYRREATQEDKRQAIAQMLPTLAGNAGYKYTSQDVKSSDNDVFDLGQTDYDTTSYGLSLTQPLFHWDLIVGYQQAKSEGFWADTELIVARQALMVRVTDLYLKALNAQDQLDYAQAEEKSVTKHYELAQGRHQMGLIPVTDLHDAKARLASVQAITIEARNNLDDALVALEEVTGAPVDALSPLQEEVALSSPDPVELEVWQKRAMDQNPSIKLQQHAVEVADYEVSKQSAAHYPTLDAVGLYKGEDTDGTVFGGGGEVETMEVLVQLNLPLYQGGIVSSRVRQAEHRLNVARQDLTRQTRAVQRQTRAAFLGVNTALNKVDALSQSITANQMALEAKQEGYLSGLFTSLNVLDAERDLSLVSIEYARARYRYVLNSLQLKQAVGTLTEEDMLRLNQWFAADARSVERPFASNFKNYGRHLEQNSLSVSAENQVVSQETREELPLRITRGQAKLRPMEAPARIVRGPSKIKRDSAPEADPMLTARGTADKNV